MPQEEHKEEEAKSGAREPLRAPAFFREWKRAQREATRAGGTNVDIGDDT